MSASTTTVDPNISTSSSSNSIVFKRGYVGASVRALEKDLRLLLEPHVARKLRERKSNTLRDFVEVSPALHVNQLLCLSATERAVYLRMIRVPRGPTLTFSVTRYSLIADVSRAARRPAPPTPNDLLTAPLLSLSNFRAFGGSDAASAKRSSSSSYAAGDDPAARVQLLTQFFQQLFPTLDPATTKLSACRRVVLVAYNQRAKSFELRHYRILSRPVGVSRAVKKVTLHRRLPNLSKTQDVADIILEPNYLSDSDAETLMETASSLVAAAEEGGSGGGGGGGSTTPAKNRAALKVQELGPRISLQLVKIEDGVSNGQVLYHSLVKKTAAELAELERRRAQAEQLREKRRQEQEENVERKRQRKEKQKNDQRKE